MCYLMGFIASCTLSALTTGLCKTLLSFIRLLQHFFICCSGESRPRNPVLHARADQRSGVAGAPAIDAGRRLGGHGGAPRPPPAGQDRNVEPRSTHQHLLGRLVPGILPERNLHLCNSNIFRNRTDQLSD